MNTSFIHKKENKAVGSTKEEIPDLPIGDTVFFPGSDQTQYKIVGRNLSIQRDGTPEMVYTVEPI